MRFLIDQRLVLSVIVLNAVALFVAAFPDLDPGTRAAMRWVDFGCLVYFVVEAVLKIWDARGFRGYWADAWNRFDFVIVAASLPALAEPFVTFSMSAFAVLTLLRLGRLLRLLRLFRFVPEIDKLRQGIVRALKASVPVFLVLALFNVILGLGANMLFGHIAPQHFGDPLHALYTLFKVFTVEGWYEVPDALAEEGVAAGWIVAVRAYFVIALLFGGLLGLSLANAIFVDEMTLDNTEKVEQMVQDLHDEVRALRAELHLQDHSGHGNGLTTTVPEVAPSDGPVEVARPEPGDDDDRQQA
ncbi:MAG: ion transporter [Bacteroidota bacterium]